MKAATTTSKYAHEIMGILSEYPHILNKIIDVQVIWHPEWKHFKIVELNGMYLLFEKHKMLFHSPSIETVKSELIEQFHFYKLQPPR
jgi:hypothetical protein